MPLKRLNPRAPSGQMNRLVTFYLPAVVMQTGPTAGNLGAPQAAFDTWALFAALYGEELDKAQQIAQKSSHLLVIPYQRGVFENMTFQFIDGGNTRSFQIEHIEDPDEQRWQLKVYCFEMGQNAGAES